MQKRLFLGIDPGKNGAIALYGNSRIISAATFKDAGIGKTIQGLLAPYTRSMLCASIENVHAFPGQGVASSFAFGRAYGEALATLDVLDIPYRKITPRTWQKGILGLPKKKDGPTAHKRFLKAEAQRRFPYARPTLLTCDAMLIAEFTANEYREHLPEIGSVSDSEAF